MLDCIVVYVRCVLFYILDCIVVYVRCVLFYMLDLLLCMLLVDVSTLILCLTNPLGRPQILKTDRHADSQRGRRVKI